MTPNQPDRPSPQNTRDLTIDILRGLAIFTMLCANAIGYVTPSSEHPVWIKFYGSFAAPLFILLAGYMASMGLVQKDYPLSYYMKRGLMVILTAVVIDTLIWEILPFTTFDVLYVIGFSLPLIYFLFKGGLIATGSVIIILFGMPPILQDLFGYTSYPTEYSLNGELTTAVKNQTSILQHFFIDGWFPVFPWLGFAFLGALFFSLKERFDNFKSLKFLISGIAGIVIGGIGLYYYPLERLLPERGAYNEIFYPPTVVYILCALGVIIVLFSITSRIQGFLIFRPLQIMGETSLFIYILHTAIISFVIEPYYASEASGIPTGTFSDAMAVYVLLTAACFIPSLLIHIIKQKRKFRNFLIRFYFGS